MRKSKPKQVRKPETPEKQLKRLKWISNHFEQKGNGQVIISLKDYNWLLEQADLQLTEENNKADVFDFR